MKLNTRQIPKDPLFRTEQTDEASKYALCEKEYTKSRVDSAYYNDN